MNPPRSIPPLQAGRRKRNPGQQRLAASLATALGFAAAAYAADVTYDFTSDPATTLTISGNNDAPWVATGGNPGGFLAATYSQNSQQVGVVFPNLDPGKIVTAFEFSADLRVGNAQGNDGRPADGFSVSFARDGDPILVDGSSGFAGGPPENGATTGIAVNFDTWSGNALPDGADIEGIIVRVDNVTINKTPLAIRNGACDDVNSLQTGPYNAAYWAGGGDPRDPAAWAGLCWQKFSIVLTVDGKLTVTYKGRNILDAFQTTYFPSAGQLVLAGRTGGANENTHFDNIKLKTTAATVTAVPNAPANFKAAELGSRRVKLTWDKAVVPGDANAQVAYEIQRDGVVIAPLVTVLTYDDRGVQPNTSYTYKVTGKNIAGLLGTAATVTAKTVLDADGFAFMKAEQWNGIGGTAVDAGTGDAHFSDAPDRTRYVNGFSFGETTNFGDTWGDNHLVKISGVFTAPKSGSFRFFVRSDDASALYVNEAGAAIPDVLSAAPIAAEAGCCGAFEEVGAPETSEVIALVAGKKYGIAFLVKEGGGGDWGQVALREEGDTTPAASLVPLRGGVLTSPVDAVGATVSITTAPVATTVSANAPTTFTAAATGSSPYGADYGNVVVYQWYQGGLPILGANGPTYTIAVTPKSLNGVKFGVAAGVAGAAAQSAEVVLTVNDDTTPPTVTSVAGSGTFDSVTVKFSEPVKDPTAITVGNYTVSGGVTLSNPVRVNDRTVRFTSSKQAEATTYTVTVKGVKDLADLSSDYTGTFKSYQFKSGLVSYKTWQGQTGGFGTWVDNSIGATAPTTDGIKLSYQANTSDEYESYFGQLTGFFVPATTGNYVFFMSSDDFGEMYLSTDSNPANKKVIAREPVWNGRREWVTLDRRNADAPENRSDTFAESAWATPGTITLQAGQKYYLEVLFKEGGGGDNGAATFKLANEADPAAGSDSKLTGNLVGTFVDPGTLPAIITKGPTHQIVDAGATATFTVEVESASPVTYKWYKNNKLVAGATGASLVIPNAGVANIGDYRVRVDNVNGGQATIDNDSRLTLKNAFVVEAEDYNQGAGKTVAAASTMPLASSLYRGLDGVKDIDFKLNENNTDSGCCGNSLRNGWVADGVTTAAEAGANVDVISDGNADRPDFTLTQNYKIGWGDANEWFNYTRDFPAGTYSASLGFSWDGRTVDVGTFALDIVTGDVTKADTQVATRVGQVTVDQTGGWSSNDNVPFMNADGTAAATFTLGANTTVRLNIPGGDIDYLLFYKLGAPPAVTAEAGGIPGITGGVSNINVNTATKTITATTTGDAGFIKVTGATKIKSVTLVGTTLTIVYE